MSLLENGRKVTVLTQSANFFLPDTLKVTGSTISTPKSYDEHPRPVKYGSPPRVIVTDFSKGSDFFKGGGVTIHCLNNQICELGVCFLRLVYTSKHFFENTTKHHVCCCLSMLVPQCLVVMFGYVHFCLLCLLVFGGD